MGQVGNLDVWPRFDPTVDGDFSGRCSLALATNPPNPFRSMHLFVAVALCLLIFPLAALVVAWIVYLKLAIEICDVLSARGANVTGQKIQDQEASSLGEECEFRTEDGLTLRGTHMRHHALQHQGVVVFCHHHGGDRNVVAPYSSALLEAGFDVFAFDFRNHGTSESLAGYAPRIWTTRHEVLDLQAAIRYVTSRDDADKCGVALMGLSRGGATALSVAAGNRQVWAVIADGAFVFPWLIAIAIRRFAHTRAHLAPLQVLYPWCVHVFYARLVHGIVALKLRHQCIHLAEDARRVQQPVMLIHGERDRAVPLELGRRLKRTIPGRPGFWIVPKARHNQAITLYPRQYGRRVCRFLLQHAPSERLQPAECVAASSRISEDSVEGIS